MAVVFEPNRIKLGRESRGLTQAQLAGKLRVSAQQLSQWERGEVVPSAENMAKIMTALESPATFFFVESGVNVPRQEHQDKERRAA